MVLSLVCSLKNLFHYCFCSQPVLVYLYIWINIQMMKFQSQMIIEGFCLEYDPMRIYCNFNKSTNINGILTGLPDTLQLILLLSILVIVVVFCDVTIL